MEAMHQSYTEAMAIPSSERKRIIEWKGDLERRREQAHQQAMNRSRGRRIR